MADNSNRVSETCSDCYEANDLNAFPASPKKDQFYITPPSSGIEREQEAVINFVTGDKNIEEFSTDLSKPQKICGNCKKTFDKYEIRNGIHIGLMIIIIIISCLLFVFVFLFLLLCKQYRVCPHCRKFTRDEKSNSKNICLW